MRSVFKHKIIRLNAIFGILCGLVIGSTSTGLVFANNSQFQSGDIYTVANITTGTSNSKQVTASKCDVLQYTIKLFNNGNYPIKDTVVRVSLPASAVTTNTSTVTLNGNNAPNTSDTATVSINPAQAISYIPGSGKLMTYGGTFINSVSDTMFGSGANIGTVSNGQSNYLYIKFQAKVDCPTPPPVSEGSCQDLAVEVVNKSGRQVSAVLKGSVNNATIIGYTINWGDGSTSSSASASHTYASNGTYSVTGSVKIKLADGTVVDKTSSACAKTVVLDYTPPPVSEGSCVELAVQVVSEQNKQVSATLKGSVNNATIVGYIINWGDGSTSSSASASHTYANYGSYNLTGTVKVKLADGSTVDKTSTGCAKSVTLNKPTPPPVSDGTCSSSDIKIVSQNPRKVSATLNGTTTNAQIVGYTINWGDGTISDARTAEHTYASAGTYNIVGTVKIKLADGTIVNRNSGACTKSVTFTNTPPPVIPVYSCDMIGLHVTGDKTVKISNFKFTGKDGAVFKEAVINWGDGSTLLTTTDPIGQSHVFEADGTYKVEASAKFMVNGELKSVSSGACHVTVIFKTTQPPVVVPPIIININNNNTNVNNVTASSSSNSSSSSSTGSSSSSSSNGEVLGSNTNSSVNTVAVLPNTGSGSMVAVFILISTISSSAYYLLARRFN